VTKKIIISFFILALIGCGAYYFYNHFLYKEARNIKSEKPSYSINSSDLIAQYKSDVAKADSKYLNKTIEIKGTVTEISDSTLTVDKSIFCKMTTQASPKLLGTTISLKGRCIGYDDLFEQVKFDQCTN